MPDARIARVRGREILDSRGRPTVEADVALTDGTVGRASVPSGASIGRHEAVELRDRDPHRYGGLGVRRAVAHIDDVIAPAISGIAAADQRTLDTRLLELDGTPRKQHLGANALLAVSLATCRAAAASRSIPLYRHIADLAQVSRPSIPLPMVNMISGGLHAGRQLDIQDVLVIPVAAHSFAEALEHVSEVYAAIRDRVLRENQPPLVADEGGWAPGLARNEDALCWVDEAIVETNRKAVMAVDIASTHLLRPEGYHLEAEKRMLDAEGMIRLVEDWAARFPLVSFEDPLGEDDWEGWPRLSAALGDRLQLLGDDLFTTNPERLARGIQEKAANAILVKANQIGTLSETLDVIQLAKSAGYRTVVSARSGETEDSFLADLAVGSAAGQIKVGSVTRSSRLSKWNQLLRIEEELGLHSYVGVSALGSQIGPIT